MRKTLYDKKIPLQVVDFLARAPKVAHHLENPTAVARRGRGEISRMTRRSSSKQCNFGGNHRPRSGQRVANQTRAIFFFSAPFPAEKITVKSASVEEAKIMYMVTRRIKTIPLW